MKIKYFKTHFNRLLDKYYKSSPYRREDKIGREVSESGIWVWFIRRGSKYIFQGLTRDMLIEHMIEKIEEVEDERIE